MSAPLVVIVTVPPLALVASNALIVVPAGNKSLLTTVKGVPGPFDESTKTLPSALYVSPAALGTTANDCWTWGAGANVALPAWFALITQVPVPMKDTVAPASEHTVLADASIVIVTGSPDVAVAVTLYVGPWYSAGFGAVDVKEIVCVCLTVNDCCTCGAGKKLASPAWLALITHVPAPMNDTVEPATEHTVLADASIVNVTVRPEVAVAVTL